MGSTGPDEFCMVMRQLSAHDASNIATPLQDTSAVENGGGAHGEWTDEMSADMAQTWVDVESDADIDESLEKLDLGGGGGDGEGEGDNDEGTPAVELVPSSEPEFHQLQVCQPNKTRGGVRGGSVWGQPTPRGGAASSWYRTDGQERGTVQSCAGFAGSAM